MNKNSVAKDPWEKRVKNTDVRKDFQQTTQRSFEIKSFRRKPVN